MLWKFLSSKDLSFSYKNKAAVPLNILREAFYNKTSFIKKIKLMNQIIAFIKMVESETVMN